MKQKMVKPSAINEITFLKLDSSGTMTKKTVIEVVTQNTEDQLDKVGALRNVAVNDAWKRVRQKIQVVSY